MVDGLAVPAPDASLDMCCAFSLFTHLLHEETYIYLQDIWRVLKPGGTLVFSFLEFANPRHWRIFETTSKQVENGTWTDLNELLERNAITAMAGHIGFTIVSFQDEPMGRYIPLSRPADFDDGRRIEDKATMGQAIWTPLKTSPNRAASDSLGLKVTPEVDHAGTGWVLGH